MSWLNNFKELLVGTLLGLVMLALAFFGGRSRGEAAARRDAEMREAAERGEREGVAAKEAVKATEDRRREEEQVNQMGPDNARKDLHDRWTRD